MTTLPLGLIVEGLVAILLILTIVYCVILNQRLKRLRADEAALRGMIGELITATEIAERAIIGLKSTAADCDKTLSERLEQARSLSENMAEQITVGDRVASRLSRSIGVENEPREVRRAPQRSSDRLRGLEEAARAAGFELPEREAV